MAGNSGFIQYGDKPPATDLLPSRAVEWLVNCQNAAALEWIFVGRWLFLDRPDEATILGDRASLARVVEETFRALLPIWLSTYDPTDRRVQCRVRWVDLSTLALAATEAPAACNYIVVASGG